MTDEIKAINRFLVSVSWADECQVLERADGRHRLLHECMVLLPTDWTTWRDNLAECVSLGDKFDVQPSFLLFGDAKYCEVCETTEEITRAGVFPRWFDLVGFSNTIHHANYVDQLQLRCDELRRRDNS